MLHISLIPIDKDYRQLYLNLIINIPYKLLFHFFSRAILARDVHGQVSSHK